MNPYLKSALTSAIMAAALPLQAAPLNSVWRSDVSPMIPYQYIESVPVLRLAPQIANAQTYASDSLYLRLYPSINTASMPSDPSIASKTRGFVQNQTRGILSSSYVQEYAYIDTYSSTRTFEEYFSFPSIRMSLAMPPYGNGFGGGYQPLQFGFNPAAFKFW
ncbi:MAG: hypothetical protein COB08_010640 [Rhodobacteraceae bacterium]|nr:hypothetical protein [Paracoccaceae bacterium]